ncbi:MAG: hypothetical protein L6Q78_12385 [Bacteroidia bacterium]|nr:hypothetical protein [Bacteroidia bacterium]
MTSQAANTPKSPLSRNPTQSEEKKEKGKEKEEKEEIARERERVRDGKEKVEEWVVHSPDLDLLGEPAKDILANHQSYVQAGRAIHC